MNLSQSLVVGWLHVIAASAIVLTLARLAMRWLPQPADRIRLVQIALATAMLLPAFIALSPLPMWELNLIPSEEERVAAPSRSTSLPADESPAMTIERSASPIVRDAPRLTTPPPSSVPQAATSPPLDLWMCCFIAIVAGHALAAMFFAIEWIIGRRRLGRLCADAEPATDRVLGEWAAVSNGHGGRAKLLISSAIDVPLMFGWRKPVVIVPRDLADGGGPSLRFCLSHEWSHIARADVLTGTATWCCQFILWMHPAYWSLRKELRLCQDLLADATAASSDAVAYSELLVALARRRLPRPAGALTLIDRPSQLIRRVTMLLKRPFDVRFERSRRLSLVLAAMAVVIAIGVGGIRFGAAHAEDQEAANGTTPSPADASTEKKENAAVPKDTDGEALRYTCVVVDKETGKGIEGARVVVRRSILKSDEDTPVAETQHTTDAEGKYEVEIPAEQVAMPYLYVRLDVEHDDYAPKKGFGYALSMIRKNEKLGERPFFEKVELYPGEAVTGTVLSPDGERLEGIKVQGFSMGDRSDFQSASFSDTLTDGEGRFRLVVHKGSDAVVWIIPKNYAIVEKYLTENRGDLGTFTLEPGVRVSGEVLDSDGKPVSHVPVQLSHHPGIVGELPVGSFVRRGVMSNKEGRFSFPPLPAGEYRIIPSDQLGDPLNLDRTIHDLRNVFVPQKIVLTIENPSPSIEVQAVPHVAFHAQTYDNAGNKIRGHGMIVVGRFKGEFWSASGRPTETGEINLRLPRGLTQTRFQLHTNEHGALRYRRGDGELMPQRDSWTDLGAIEDDILDFEIVRYRAPLVVVSAVDKDGKAIDSYRVFADYPWETERLYNEDGIVSEVHLERQTDGRIRTKQMLPDEDVTFTISAEGYEDVKQTINLPEGETKELTVTLKKAE